VRGFLPSQTALSLIGSRVNLSLGVLEHSLNNRVFISFGVTLGSIASPNPYAAYHVPALAGAGKPQSSFIRTRARAQINWQRDI